MRVLHILGPHHEVPTIGYGGTERVVEALVTHQIAAGLDVGTFTVGSSRVPGRRHWHFPQTPQRLDEQGHSHWDFTDDVVHVAKAMAAARDYDVVHNHTEFALPLLGPHPVPALTTLHSYSGSGGSLDRLVEAFPDTPGVAISASQRALLPRPTRSWPPCTIRCHSRCATYRHGSAPAHLRWSSSATSRDTKGPTSRSGRPPRQAAP